MVQDNDFRERDISRLKIQHNILNPIQIASQLAGVTACKSLETIAGCYSGLTHKLIRLL
jgi:hypothetical protein